MTSKIHFLGKVDKGSMEKASDLIHKMSTGWIVLTGIVIFLLFTFFILPKQASLATQSTGSEKSPDLSFYYSRIDLYQMAEL
jgi:hypothetical protein